MKNKLKLTRQTYLPLQFDFPHSFGQKAAPNLQSTMNLLEADGAPRICYRLFQLGDTLSVQKRHRYAALAFSAASRLTGTTSRLQAYALYKAARQLYESIKHTPDDSVKSEDTARAISYLQKCSLLLRQDRAAFDMHMQIFALLEHIYTHTLNHHAAAKTINTALYTVPKDAETTPHRLRWWCYFRARAVANSLVKDSTVDQACTIAVQSAQQCERLSDFQSAAAFHLIQCQISLGSSGTNQRSIAPNLAEAHDNLDRFPPVENGRVYIDDLILQFAYRFLQSLALIREGDVHNLKNSVLSHLSKCYNRLRAARKENDVPSVWRWLPYHYLSAMTFYITTTVSRGFGDNSKALLHAVTALARLGIKENDVTQFTLDKVQMDGVSRRGTLSLVVALLETAARLRLTEVCLEEAAPLIAATIDLTFQDEASRVRIRNAEAGLPLDIALSTVLNLDVNAVGLIPRCTALLLLAEYHNLRGKVSGARVATDLLHAVRLSIVHRAANARQGPPVDRVTDTWQMAVSYLSLLTGDKRSEIAIATCDDADLAMCTDGDDNHFSSGFVSTQVNAMAHFTNGVYYMRATDVLESKRALRNCIDLVHGNTGGNEQLLSNAMTVLSGQILTREHISDEAAKMTSSAVILARTLNDPVSLVRATRQHKKLADRLHFSPEDRQEADKTANDSLQALMAAQKQAGLVFPVHM